MASDPTCSPDCTYSHHGFHTVDCGKRSAEPTPAPARPTAAQIALVEACILDLKRAAIDALAHSEDDEVAKLDAQAVALRALLTAVTGKDTTP